MLFCLARASRFFHQQLPINTIRRLKQLGFEFHRQAAGSHEILLNASTNRYTPIPNHPGDMPEGMLRAILKQADVEAELFLQQR